MRSATDPEVVIIGGGLAGMALGLALTRAGIESVLLEARPAPPQDLFGFVLWPPGTRTLDWLDVLPAVRARGCTLDRLAWFDPAGEEMVAVSLSDSWSLTSGFLGVLPSAVDKVLADEGARCGLRVITNAADWQLKRVDDGFRVAVGESTFCPRLVVGADGPSSAVRRWAGLGGRTWRPPGQAILTGVANLPGERQSGQTMGPGWSVGTVDVGHGRSWRYGIFRGRDAPADTAAQVPARLPTQVGAVACQLERHAVLRPASVRVPRWAADGVVLMGDAAHGMLPHLGLGGSLTLSGVPVLTDVIARALADKDTSAGRLAEFQRVQQARVAHARRACELWALGCTLPGFGLVRDFNFKRLRWNSDALTGFVNAMCGVARPSLGCRMSVWLP